MKNKQKKSKIKTGDLVEVISGQWKKTKDYVSAVKPKKQVVFLKKISRKVFDKSPENKEKSLKKEIMIPLKISKVKKKES